MSNIKVKAGYLDREIYTLQTRATIQKLKMNKDTAEGLAYINKDNKFQHSQVDGYQALYDNGINVIVDNLLPYNEVQIEYEEMI